MSADSLLTGRVAGIAACLPRTRSCSLAAVCRSSMATDQ
jgi:hypothetical protein